MPATVGVVPLALLLGGLFGLGGLGSTAVAVVLPQAAESLDISLADSTWLISLYALAMAVSTPVYGRLVDLFGIRIPLLGGVVLMTAGAVLAATSTSFPVIVVARLLQGLGTGVGPTLSVAVISTRFVGADRARGLGIAAGTAGAVGATGPLIGGLTEAAASWRATTALPALALVILALLWRHVHGAGGGNKFDVPGAILVSVAAAGLIMLLQSPTSGAVVAVAGGLMVTLAAPLVVRRSIRLPQGFLPSSVLLNGALVRTCLVGGTVPAAWFALLVAVPMKLFQQGWSPAQVGLAMLPSAAVAVLVPRYAPAVSLRLGAPRSLVLASSLAALALVVAGVGARLELPAVMVAGVAIVSGAFSIGQPALFSIVGDSSAAEVRGVAMGFATLVFLTCGSAGAAVVGGMSGVLGVAAGLLVLAVACVIGAAVAVHGARRPPGSAAVV